MASRRQPTKASSRPIDAVHVRSDPVYVVKAQLFRVLGHPVRIRILELLVDGERTVGQLQAELDLDSSGTSQGANDTIGGSGGVGGAGSAGGTVKVTTSSTSNIQTNGLMNYGIEAQSVGGGGGNGGFAIGGSYASNGDTKSTIGGSGTSGLFAT